MKIDDLKHSEFQIKKKNEHLLRHKSPHRDRDDLIHFTNKCTTCWHTKYFQMIKPKI